MNQKEKQYIIKEKELQKLESCDIENCDGSCPDEYCSLKIGENIRKREFK